MSDDLASGLAGDETPNDLEMRRLFEQLGMRRIILERAIRHSRALIRRSQERSIGVSVSSRRHPRSFTAAAKLGGG